MKDAKKNKVTPADPAVIKLAHWLRHVCRCTSPDLEEMLADNICKKGSRLEKILVEKCGLNHPQLGEAIDNTVQLING